ncbi:MAG: Ppx/GppA phosphatase family protein [bacterium]
MRIAVLDVGTNTLRLLIRERSSSIVIFRKNYYLFLGSSCINGVLSKEGLERLNSALTEIKEILSANKVSKVIGVATAFARNIKNSEELFQTIKSVLPCDIRLIDGKTEGTIVALAVSEWFRPVGDFLVIDAGGGSTEFIYKSNKGFLVESHEFGSLVLTNNFFTTYPPNESDVNRLFEYLHTKLATLPALPPSISVFGVGGTFTTAAFLLSGKDVYDSNEINGYPIHIDELETFYNEILKLKYEQLLSRYPLEEGRERVLLAGVIEVLEIMKTLDIGVIRASDISLIDGVLPYFKDLYDLKSIENAFSS